VSPLDGSLDAPGDRDWYDLGKLPGASLFSLSATGAATGVAATEAGAAGDRALPSNLHVDLYQSNAGSPVLLTSSTDGLIENFTLPAPDSYFAVVTADPSTAGVGAYHFGALLDAARPAPAGASAPAEQEPNDDAASATPIGGRWRDMVYSADRAFDLEWFDYEALGDIDYAEYRFTQGDLLSVAFQQRAKRDTRFGAWHHLVDDDPARADTAERIRVQFAPPFLVRVTPLLPLRADEIVLRRFEQRGPIRQRTWRLSLTERGQHHGECGGCDQSDHVTP